jgi:Xaa-Pro aminopeptidase
MLIAKTMSKRLADLRKLMKDHSLIAYIVPHQDAHNSEYISASDERIHFICNFDGSAGTCVITPNQALLWTDGRYFNQATQQLPSEWTLMKDRLPGTPKISDFLAKLGSGFVGVDPLLTSVATYKDLEKKVQFKCVEVNLVDQVWAHERPIQSLAEVHNHPIQFSGQDRKEKLKLLRDEMAKEHVSHMLVCALDEVAWTLNLRGSDIDYNPVFFAYLAIEAAGKTILFLDDIKLPKEVRDLLVADHIDVMPYGGFLNYIKTSVPEKSKVWVDPESANCAVYQAIPSSCVKHEETLPIVLFKACKTATEIEGMRACHIRDGAAEVKWMHWLFTSIMNDESKYMHHTEVTLADKLEDFRKEMDLFKGLSFGSISSFGSNAAIIHYHAKSISCAPADPSKIYLIDSGGQYSDGTTDVTRTVHFGNPTAEEKDAFTRVLKGVIQLSMTKFPPGTTGPALDGLARHALWQAGLDYRHGTGHGVGSFLNVHEGPCGISPPMFSARSQALKTALKPGMVLSNEPGYYEDGNFGIRIENLMAVTESDLKFKLGKDDQKMLSFETLTMIPIQKKLIDVELLTDSELEWLNAYHASVLEKLTPFMDQEQLDWLRGETEPLARESKPVHPKRSRK